MTARCASCNYPLTISDSVVCYECTSYFHIDCAQLVGFPIYPERNTFHCSTCKLLPLPQRVDSDSDSGSDSDGGAMPSRQLDYNIEERSDYTNDMNEVKGSIQDLSSLCKDMLREINELKSINLTLRCSIENLRHDSSRRDGVIADLQRRIEALENNKSRPHVSLESADWSLDSVVLERDEEMGRYSPQETVDVRKATQLARVTSPVNVLYSNEAPAKGSESETSDYLANLKEDEESFRKNVSDNEPEIQDWTWKGNNAIEIENADSSYKSKTDSIDEEQKEQADEDNEWEENEDNNCGVQQNELLVQQSSDERRLQDNYEDEEEDDEDSEEEKTQYEIGEMKILRGNEECEYSENPPDEIQTSNNLENKQDHWEVRTELGSEVESVATLDEHELCERLLGEALTAIDESQPGEDQSGDEEPRLTEEANRGDGGGETEGDVDRSDRLEGLDSEHEYGLGETELHHDIEADRDLESAEIVDRDADEVDEQHPEAFEGEGEARLLSEDGIEIIEPPAEPQHTESDLWDYLKDTVSSVHPSTVEEFLENLIGTLQHVPEEYFKPVIDANIRRANSPSVTDGEHLTTLDAAHEDGEATDSILESQQQNPEENLQETAPTDLAVDEGYMPLEVND